MDSFFEFDFEAVPDHTPLDRLFQEELRPYLSRDHAQGCFIPIPAQTGIGKTRSAAGLILERLLERIRCDIQGQPAPALTYYITNSVDNVAETANELRSLIDHQTVKGQPRFSGQQRQVLKHKILHLPAQDVQLLNTESCYIERIMEAFELVGVDPIQKGWYEIQRLRESVRGHREMEAALSSTLHDKALTVYRLIVDAVQTRQRTNPVQLDEPTTRALDALLPGDRARRGEVGALFMTTSKFLHGYQTSRNRVYPIRHLENALLVVDEIDRQNEVILDVLCDQKVRDLIGVTRTLNANLNQHVLEDSPRYQGVEELFTPLRRRLREFAETWQTRYSFDIDGDNLADKPIRLFSDRTVTHSNSATHRLFLTTDQAKQKNVIVGQEKSEQHGINPSADRLSRFVNQADWLYRNFLNTMRIAVWKIIDNEKGNERAPDALFQEAVISLLSQFNLREFASDVFASFDTQLKSLSRRDKKMRRVSQRSYHDSGLKMVDLSRQAGEIDTVSCRFHGLSVSPSGLLAQMVESGARVLGVSATATSPTVVRNFDQHYLKARLRERYMELSEAQAQIIGAYYQRRRQYEANGVHPRVTSVASDINVAASAVEAFEGKPVRCPNAVLEYYLDKSEADDSGGTYLQAWVSRVLIAIKEFARLDSNRYMVLLLNRTLNPARVGAFERFLRHYLASIGLSTVHLYLGLDAAAIREGRFEAIQETLANTSEKVIVFSTYASMGEGKNPDYPVEQPEDRESLIWVGEGDPPHTVRADIDTLYLEKPTYQLMGDSENYYRDRLMKLHQIMCLQEDGWVSPQKASSWVLRTLRGAADPVHLKHYYETEDANWLMRKVVEQAVGRMARTAFKRQTIAIMAEHSLVRPIAEDPRSHETLSHEYAAMINAFYDTLEKGADFNSINERRHYNKALLHTFDTLEMIQELLNGINKGIVEEIENWELVRQQLLAQPTVETIPGDHPRLYLKPPGKGGYSYQGNLDIHPGVGREQWNDLKLFDQAEKGRIVSEAESSLPVFMNNPIVHHHFKMNGFATVWAKCDYMMTPAAFINIYKGALGEEAVKAVLINVGFTLENMPAALYERFDIILVTSTGQRVCVDIKHWSQEGDAPHHQSKADLVRDEAEIRHFVYINALGMPDQAVRCVDDDFRPNEANGNVLVVPGLLHRKTGEVLQSHLNELMEWLETVR